MARKYMKLSAMDDEVSEKADSTIDGSGSAARSSLRRLRYLLLCLICLIGTLVIMIVFLISARSTRSMLKIASSGKLRHDPLPQIPDTIIYFGEFKEFSARPSPETERAWNSLLPPGRGYVFVDNRSQYNLQPGEPTPWGEIFSVTLFHQLHCIAMIRDRYWQLLDSASRQSADLMALVQKFEKNHHINHCFDYLRQSTMCAGDMTLEWPRTEKDGRRFKVDGWGIPHRCKSWDAILDYMEQNHYNGSQRSDIAR